MDVLHINLFGEFSLSYQGNTITDNSNRSKKIWLLLAYLICHKERVVSQRELIRSLLGDQLTSNNPENVLRITIHRLRTQLNQLWPSAGNELILFKENGYCWNTSVKAEIDYEKFESLCCEAKNCKDFQAENLLKAIDLYKGGFFEKQDVESWVIPIATHYHNQFIEISVEAARHLFEHENFALAESICRKAISYDPYHEELYQILMKSLGAMDYADAVKEVYGELKKKLFDDFGISPSEETFKVYRAAANTLKENTLSMDDVLQHLVEPESDYGAMQCDYESFKLLSYYFSRSMQRSGRIAHVVMLSMTDGEKTLSKRSMQRILAQLGKQIQINLRKGDFFARLSVTQYVIMLPEANYENSCMVARRILSAFFKKHPHVSTKIHFLVRPLQAGLSQF